MNAAAASDKPQLRCASYPRFRAVLLREMVARGLALDKATQALEAVEQVMPSTQVRIPSLLRKDRNGRIRAQYDSLIQNGVGPMMAYRILAKREALSTWSVERIVNGRVKT